MDKDGVTGMVFLFWCLDSGEGGDWKLHIVG